MGAVEDVVGQYIRGKEPAGQVLLQPSIFLSSITASTFFCYMLVENTSLKKTVTQIGIGRHPVAKPVTALQFYQI
jgi:hypothetical protein